MAQLFRAIVRIALFPVFVLAPAGTLAWWEGWVVCGLYMVYAVGTGIWLARADPELLRERMRASPVQEGQAGWDKLVLTLMAPLGLLLIVVPGLDVVRWGWSEPFPVVAELVAMALHLPALAFIGWVMHTNTFLSRVVKIDEARGHEVITTGPYAIVRHPMYLAVIVLLLAFPVALGSRWGLGPAAAMVGLFVVRTALEDRTLHRELAGYEDYAKQTRSRLFPGLW